MPVIAVDDIRPEIHGRNEAEHGTAEEGEPFCIVIVAVEALAVIVFLIIHEIIGDTLVFQFLQAHELGAPGHIYLAIIDMFHLGAVLLGDFAKLGHNYPDIHSLQAQCLWKRACHIRQPACFSKRHRFRCYI